ncbi:hypothetical protein BN7_2563 [Wickerhamomyces ciferrii]|uniref:Rad60/SUMO-like domain-containing protein n=1 Tax=Wickerhamomyces ciferrii (strain ATCC 14091 / BCRC 22168 / CBS 111 / JCM 3599 / NBRC 0793 / NRRL Y-1031 F-60-10) TaxID=1206466 RepID=K0KJ65_WICCF|nr:uncharacterized protein BN7_2563 [Wickerhamomyces ciferrii]CCH43016.1 hypothetical protein BN7_2563 [Wickerhamomyces ciferrii]
MATDYIRLGFKVPTEIGEDFLTIYDQNARFYLIAKEFAGAHNQPLTQINLKLGDQRLDINSTPRHLQAHDKDTVSIEAKFSSISTPSWTFANAITKAIEKLEEANPNITIIIKVENSSVCVVLNMKRTDKIFGLKEKFQRATDRNVTSILKVNGQNSLTEINDETILSNLELSNGITFEVQHDGEPLTWDRNSQMDSDSKIPNPEGENSKDISNSGDQEVASSSSSSRVFGSISITSMLESNDEDGDTIMEGINDEETTSLIIGKDPSNSLNREKADQNKHETIDNVLVSSTLRGESQNLQNQDDTNDTEIENAVQSQNLEINIDQNISKSTDIPVIESNTSIIDESTDFPAANQQSIERNIETPLKDNNAQTFLDNSQAWDENTISDTQTSTENNIGTQRPPTNDLLTFEFKVTGTDFEEFSFSLGQNETFKSVLNDFKSKHPQNSEATLRFLKRVIEPTDTPNSINASKNQSNEINVLNAEPDVVTFVLTDTSNKFRPVYLKAKLKIKLKKVFEIYASKNKLNWKELTFKFEGKILKRHDTPLITGLQNGSKVEVILPQEST